MPANSAAISSADRRAVPSSQTAVIMAASPGLSAGSCGRPAGKDQVQVHQRKLVLLDQQHFHAVGEPAALDRRQLELRLRPPARAATLRSNWRRRRRGRRRPAARAARERAWPSPPGRRPPRPARRARSSARGPGVTSTTTRSGPRYFLATRVTACGIDLHVTVEILGQVAGIAGEDVVHVQPVGPAAELADRLQRPDESRLERIDGPGDLLGRGRLGLDAANLLQRRPPPPRPACGPAGPWPRS